jgi:hypothetical protein
LDHLSRYLVLEQCGIDDLTCIERGEEALCHDTSDASVDLDLDHCGTIQVPRS